MCWFQGHIEPAGGLAGLELNVCDPDMHIMSLFRMGADFQGGGGDVQKTGSRVLATRVSGCLLDSLVHEKYLILGKKILVCVFL